MRWIDFNQWDLPALAANWRRARPFPHVVIDGLVGPTALDELRRGIAGEAHAPERSEIVYVMGSAQSPAHPTLRDFAAFLGRAEALSAIGAITGKVVSTVEVRSYVYLAGAYLLPHTDYRPGVDRRLAFAYYLSPEGGCVGGELDLYECELEVGEIVRTTVAETIVPRPDRLALFDVSEVSLHRVREVIGGARVSLAGWFL